ncbi:hypothetical protein K491DRAFT_713541 [Lophiostoma macrostomum CBS 122681]|uniref:Cnl2/NKP2 family protein n=1 Tax=Lophiostoma macrostomum CBS 122681 TaxID=1314788 RepID=A0A6A6TG03_9PLEO|nr:hypothetical protein K491DRAFT_713541 [Lophiostoma macrostomum CBS 122681]
MSTQEAKLLSDFLLAPAALRDVLTLKEFTDIFPKAYRTQPAVKDLYQELQRLRQEDIETVRQNVVDEVKKSKRLRREIAQSRELHDRSAVAGLDPVALQMEEELSGNQSRRKAHTLQTIHPAIEDACESIENQLVDMEREIQSALSEVQDAVGELSDLRYGSFSKPATGEDISEEVIATLKRLEAACAS